MKRALLILLFVLALIPVGAVFGQSSSANFVTQRFVIGAGDSAESTNYKLSSVIGQATTDHAASSNFKVSSGFLTPGASIPTSIGLASSASQSLLPFWILLGAALTLLVSAFLISRRASSKQTV